MAHDECKAKQDLAERADYLGVLCTAAIGFLAALMGLDLYFNARNVGLLTFAGLALWSTVSFLVYKRFKILKNPNPGILLSFLTISALIILIGAFVWSMVVLWPN